MVEGSAGGLVEQGGARERYKEILGRAGVMFGEGGFEYTHFLTFTGLGSTTFPSPSSCLVGAEDIILVAARVRGMEARVEEERWGRTRDR